MSIETDLALIAEQEKMLVFPAFDGDVAWRLGGILRNDAAAVGPVTIEIQVGGHVLLRHAMPGAAPITADWARRKANVALRFHESSYAIGLRLRLDNANLWDKYGLPEAEFAAHGGAVPLRVSGIGVVGVVVISGLPQRLDHVLTVRAMAQLLGIAVPDLDVETSN